MANWLLVLGLDFDPAPNDMKYLQTVIDKKKKFWVEHSLDQLDGAYYTMLKDSSGTIENAVLDSAQRNAMAEDAKTKVYGLLDKFLKTAAAAGGKEDEIEEERIADVVKKLVKRIQKTEGIKGWDYSLDKATKYAERHYTIVKSESANDEEAARAYEPYSKGSRWSAFRDLDKALRSFGASDLYAFAFPDRGAAARTEESETILSVIKRFYDAKSIHHNQEKTNAETIYNKAKDVFSTDQKRAEYGEYLAFLNVDKALEDLRDSAELSNNMVSEGVFGEAAKAIAPFVEDKASAPLIVKGFCLKKGLALKSSSGAIFCRCGHPNQPSATTCAHCGLSLRIQCPRCGKSVANSVNYCECRQPIGKALSRAEENCAVALSYLKALDFEKAHAALEQARNAWPAFAVCEEVESEIRVLEQRAGSQMAKLKEALARKAYYEAKGVLEGLRLSCPNYGASVEGAQIFAGIEESRKAVKAAEAATSEDEKVKWYTQALLACSDCAEAASYMRSHEPEPAADLCASVDQVAHVVRLSWRHSASKGDISYVLRRKEGSLPSSVTDGDEVLVTSGAQGEDKTARSGCEYYYALFTMRSGTASAPCVLRSPVCVFGEVEGLKVIPGDACVEFQWKPMGGSARVRVNLEEPSKAVLTTTSGSHFVHEGLQNGLSYAYRVSTVYDVGGKTHTTEGVSVEATPITGDDAVFDLRALRAKGSSAQFDLTWSERPGSHVLIYEADRREDVPEAGALATMADIESFAAPVLLRDAKAGRASLSYGGQDPIFVFAVVVYGKTAIVGNTVRVCGQEEVKITDVYQANDKIMVCIDPPERAIGFVVITRSDRFASGIEERTRDGDQTRQSFTKSAYRKNGVLAVNGAAARDYYLSVFAMYGSPQAPLFSEPAECFFSNKPKDRIVYSIKSANVPFMAPKATLSFKAAKSDFVLPATTVVYGIGGLPIFEGDGVQILHIPEQRVSGSLECEVAGLPKRKNIYLKAMPSDAAFDPYQLDPRSNAKIC